MRRDKIKWFFTVLALLIAVIVGRSIPDDGLGDRAMAVGLGIDVTEDGKVEVCAQILSPSDTSDAGVGTRVVCEEGELLDTAVSKITEVCGGTLTVTHCNVVLLGEKLAGEEKAFGILRTLLANTYVSDNAYVFVCEGSPKDVLGSSSAFGQNASEYLQQLISMYGTYENITYKTLREIVTECYRKGNATYMPYLTKRPVDGKIPPSGSYEEQKEKKDVSYDLNRVLVWKDGVKVGMYGDGALRAINYLLTEVHKGSDDFTVPSGKVGVFVLDNRTKKTYDLEKKTFSVELEIGVTVKDYQPHEKKNFGKKPYVLEGEDRVACETALKNEIETFYDEMKAKDVDVFGVEQCFYAKYGKKGDLSFRDVSFDLTVKLKPKT